MMKTLVRERKPITNLKYQENSEMIDDQKTDGTTTGDDRKRTVEGTIGQGWLRTGGKADIQKTGNSNRNVKKVEITGKNCSNVSPTWTLKIITNFETIKNITTRYGAVYQKSIRKSFFNGLFRNCDRSIIKKKR